MKALEIWLRGLFIATAVNTVLWLSGLGCLLYVVLMISVIGIPLALFLYYSPTILIYMLIALPTWLLFRRRSLWLAAAASLPAMLGFGLLLPHLANRRVDKELAAVTGRDHGGPMLLPTGQRVAILENWDSKSEPQCREECQRLLFSGVASMVLVGPVAALDGKADLMAYFIARNKGRCQPPVLPDVRADTKDIGTEIPYALRPALSSRLSAVYGSGHCLFAEPQTINTANIVLISQSLYEQRLSPAMDIDWRLGWVDGRYRARILLRNNGRLVERVRRTHGTAFWPAMPLRLEPPTADDSGSKDGHWDWHQVRDFGKGPYFSAYSFVRNDLSVGGLVGYRGVIYRMDSAARLTPDS